MKYDTQFIIALNTKEGSSAMARQAKRQLANEGGQSLLFLVGSPINLPQDKVTKNSRLLIHADGVPNLAAFEVDRQFGGGFNDDDLLSPLILARKIEGWLHKKRIKRISLQVCYAGGNRTGHSSADMEKWEIQVSKSFAYELARHCGYADEISARTDVVATEFRSTAKSREDITVENIRGPVYGGVDAINTRRGAADDKVLFYPNPLATPDNPVDPKFDILQARTKRKIE